MNENTTIINRALAKLEASFNRMDYSLEMSDRISDCKAKSAFITTEIEDFMQECNIIFGDLKKLQENLFNEEVNYAESKRSEN